MMDILPEDLAAHHYFFVVALIVLVSLYLHDLCTSRRCSCDDNEMVLHVYSYDGIDGPQCWKQFFESARGDRQSPINILYSSTFPAEPVRPLVFSEEFHKTPTEMRLYNNTHNVVVYANWRLGKPPSLSGGPLDEQYRFLNMRFRWGHNDKEGSEHMIASTRYSMELQAAFIKSSVCDEDMTSAARNGSLMMLSYLFMVTPVDNPYLEPVVTGLRYIKHPLSYVCIEPIILSLLMPEFSRDFYAYHGSLTFPPCTEGVLWIVKPEPLMVSSRQINQFRRIRSYCGYIENNARPVEKINDRIIDYYG
ncbi:unnamed protein product [Phyllotreta striolata]|uniref:Alpha-carbonic anhydrase domain-containing protein n=1 Tax=Phyllotreta striolata TaxID=444603 RepID=A0A9N9XSW8_PHYSR|nr:unnamed protein product [Phyllotreta striolata]